MDTAYIIAFVKAAAGATLILFVIFYLGGDHRDNKR
jgi:hypothetical protein